MLGGSRQSIWLQSCSTGFRWKAGKYSRQSLVAPDQSHGLEITGLAHRGAPREGGLHLVLQMWWRSWQSHGAGNMLTGAADVRRAMTWLRGCTQTTKPAKSQNPSTTTTPSSPEMPATTTAKWPMQASSRISQQLSPALITGSLVRLVPNLPGFLILPECL